MSCEQLPPVPYLTRCASAALLPFAICSPSLTEEAILRHFVPSMDAALNYL
jgi:hypothetical protein